MTRPENTESEAGPKTGGKRKSKIVKPPEWAREAAGVTVEPREVPDPDVWEALDTWNDAPKRSLANVVRILEQDPRWAGRIVYDDFCQTARVKGEPVSDEGETEIALWVSRVYGIEVATARVHEAVLCVAQRHHVHPVREWLDGLRWDGKARIDGWLVESCGAPDLPIIRQIARAWMISAVARAMKPGCKVDTSLILVGRQGAGKSSAYRALMPTPEWFSDSRLDIGSKDAYGALCGVFVYELAELDTVKRSESSATKAFLSSREDKYRPAYGRNEVRRPRQCVIVGSTNESEFLTDPTGSRRFWPVPAEVTGLIRVDVIEANREQWWAEAVAAYRAGERWWLDADGETQVATLSEHYQPSDTWEPLVQRWLGTRTSTTAGEVLDLCLGVSAERQDRASQMRIATILRRIGWERYREQREGLRVWIWRDKASQSGARWGSALPPVER